MLEVAILLGKVIAEGTITKAQREVITLAKERAELLEKKVGELESELAATKKKNAELESQISTQTKAKEFIEHRGACFKRLPKGGYEMSVYCSTCHGSMVSAFNQAPYHCTKCRKQIGMTGRDLSNVITELLEQYG
jgi:hypothetical protein